MLSISNKFIILRHGFSPLISCCRPDGPPRLASVNERRRGGRGWTITRGCLAIPSAPLDVVGAPGPKDTYLGTAILSSVKPQAPHFI
jgi:hypothetical protein